MVTCAFHRRNYFAINHKYTVIMRCICCFYELLKIIDAIYMLFHRYRQGFMGQQFTHTVA